jgi:signal recognition particle subunit SRP54
MGDVLTLIEQAKEHFDEAEAEEAASRLLEGKFTFEDFLEQMQQMKKMGSMNKILGMLPGVPKEIRNVDIDDREIARLEGMIRAMTPAERREPELIDGSRRLRIANGSGTTTSEVNQLLKQFKEVQRMMKGLGVGPGRGKKGKKKGKGGGRVTRPTPPAAVGKGGLPGLKLPDKPEFKLPGLP